MKKFTFWLMSLLLVSATGDLMGQYLTPTPGVSLTPPSRTVNLASFNGSRTTACAPDTAEYPLGKATGLQAINVSGGVAAVGQYFDCPQPITISGFDFVGWSDSLPVTNVTCQVYAAGTDSLPTGAPLATTTFGLDSAFGGGALAVLTRSVSFTTPVTVNAPYVIVIENTSVFNTPIVCNSYAAIPADGQGEDLSSIRFGATWTPGSGVNVGGTPFDADWLIYPHVSYSLTADFAASPACLPGANTTATFTNASSPILNNRMYSLGAFLGQPSLSYTWNFGDGSPVVNAVDTFHVYTTPGVYSATLTDTLFGWRSNCTHDTSFTLAPQPTAAFTSSASGLTVSFTDASTGSPAVYLWDFGDGNNAGGANPTHTYAAAGTYTVCLTVVSSTATCGDSTCATITVGGTPPPTTSCGPDTVEYTLGKASGLQAINVSGGIGAVGQYFDCPQPITISGFDFVGWSDSLPVTNVTCQVYAAGTDSLPTGGPLVSTTFALDSSFGGGALAVLTRSVGFPTAITVNAPYVVVIENTSAFNTPIVCNSYAAVPPDGQGEDLSSIRFGATWTPGSGVNVGGVPFDADWLIYPHASYELDADFTASPNCLAPPSPQITFTNNSSPILGNRMYNIAAFVGDPGLSYTWNFGDGSPEVNVVDTTYAYGSTGPFTVTLTDTIFGWRTVCAADTSIILNPGPSSSFSSSANNLVVTFTNASSGAPSSFAWDFGDGNTSTLENPVHTYGAAGTYTVCLTVSNGTCDDTFCDMITVAPCALPTPAFSSNDLGLQVTFTDASTSQQGGITNWLWDFGDGNTSTMQNPVYTYAAPGNYTVCLTVTDACGTDSSCSVLGVDTLVNITDPLSFQANVFPNPASSILNVEVELDQSQYMTLKVYNSLGAFMQEVRYDFVSQERIQLQIEDLAEGAYMLEIQAGDRRAVKRFTVIR